jgi:hypothetical protein
MNAVDDWNKAQNSLSSEGLYRGHSDAVQESRGSNMENHIGQHFDPHYNLSVAVVVDQP